MIHLLPGLRKFSETVFPQQKTFFEKLTAGQKPHTLLITCSDSRIDPNLVTQTKPGELFVVRNVGNIVPTYGATSSSEAAAIEFAIVGLGVTNIVICGHSQCGAMGALANHIDLEPLPSVKSWLLHAHETDERIKEMKNPDLQRVIEENVLVQVKNLKTHPSVASAMESGSIHIFGWNYSFETGTISVYDPSLGKFIPSTDVTGDSEARLAL